jgi:protein CpxP
MKMKNLIVLALLSLTLSGFAQEKKKRMNEERPEMTTQQRSELQLKKLTLELDLTAQQQKEIAEIIGKQQMNREAMRTEMKNKKAENKKLTNDEKFVLKSQVLDEKIAFKNEMKKVLNSKQLEKWEKMPKHNKQRGKKMMKRKQQTEN